MDQLLRRFTPRQNSLSSHRPFFSRSTSKPGDGSPSIQHAQSAPSIGWSPPSGSTQGPGPSRLGHPHGDSYSRHDDAFAGGFRQPGNSASPIDNQPIAQTNSVSVYSTGVRDFSTSVRDESRAWFLAIDQEGNGELSCEDLRHALLNNSGLRFSTNTVKYLVNIFDQDGDGVIKFDEFVPLWDYLNKWRQMFDAFDIRGEGRIDTADFGRALANYDVHVGPAILDMVVKKYGILPSRNRQSGYGGAPARPQMDLDQFLCACIMVREMCTLYDGCTARSISRDDFLKAIISLP